MLATAGEKTKIKIVACMPKSEMLGDKRSYSQTTMTVRQFQFMKQHLKMKEHADKFKKIMQEACI